MRKLIQSKMKDVPPAEQEKMIKLIETNPELFQKIGTEVQALMKNGKDQMAATMEVMQKYQSELQKIL